MSGSTITAFLPIPEGSDGTPGLWNSRFQALQDNIVSVNSVVLPSVNLSASTWASIGLQANSNNSDYIRFKDTSGQRSTYRLGSNAGGTADGLNIWDESGQTMIASFSKQSIRFYQNVVGPVFDVGGALASTLNAGTFGSGVDSKESRIAAAIVAASNQGIARVYVPANMYPYSASSVSFIDSVQMIREGGNAAEWDVVAWGAALDGVTDDTAAFRNAITGLPARGGVVTIPQGIPRLTASLSTAINAKRSVTLKGHGTFGSNGVSAPPVRWPTVIYVKELSNYLFSLSGTTIESFRMEGLAFDGSNGGATRTTTCPGLVESPVGQQMNFLTLQDVGVFGWNYTHTSGVSTTNRAVFDLDVGVTISFNRVFTRGIQDGRVIFTGPGSTTFNANRCYFQDGREVFYHRVGTNIVYDTCVFESYGVVGSTFLSDLHLINPYFENIGQNGATGPAGGLTPRNHGISGGVGTLLSGVITTGIQQLYGHMALIHPTMQTLFSGGSSLAWLEAIGVTSVPGGGGSLKIVGGKKNDAALADSLFSSTMAFNRQERGTDFTISLEDTWGTSPAAAIIYKTDDARKVNSGRVRLQMTDQSTFQLADVRRGNFILNSQDTVTSFTSTPGGTVYPRNDQWIPGDQIVFHAPSANSYVGLICTATSGTSLGVWGAYGHIDASGQNPVYTSASIPLLNSGTTVSGDVVVAASGSMSVKIRDTSQPADAKDWGVQNAAALFRIRAINDAESSGNNAITISRNGASVRTIDLLGEAWFESGLSALASVATFSRISSSVSVVANALWTSGLSVGNATAGGTLIPAISSTSSLVAAFVVQGSSSSFTVVAWTGVQPGDQIMVTIKPDAAVSSMSSGLLAHSHCTQANQIEFRLSNVSTLVQNQSSKTWYFTRISPF